MSKKFTYDEAVKASLDYFKGDELAASVFVGKYALRNDKNDIVEATPQDMHIRLSKEFARIEAKYPNAMSEEEIFAYLNRFQYIVPQGSPMSAIGNTYQIQSASNCFVIPSPLDSYAGILTTDQEQAQIMKRRGGVGFDISNIRPKGVFTRNAAKTTDGIGVFMERFSNTCREVAQGGRRGALMLTISCHHPEIRTFINIKKDKTKVTGANISIRLSDEFMNAVKNEGEVELRWPVESKNPLISQKVNAKELWNEIIQAAWESAEPGLLFWDTALKFTPADIYSSFGFGSTATNPCGEIILSPYDSCRLMVVNLFSFVKNPFTLEAIFDYKLFQHVVGKAQRLMDDMIDLEVELVEKIIDKIKNDPEPESVKRVELDLWVNIRKACLDGRRTGLGITALGDTLAALGIHYGSKESIEVTEEIYKNLAIGSYRASCELAKERGAFPIFDRKLEEGHAFLQRIWDAAPDVYELYKQYGRRNIANLTTAPTGSVSCLTQTTSGIEPAYLLSYTRRKKINPNDKNARVDFVDPLGDKWQHYEVYHHGFQMWMDINGKTKDNISDSPYYKSTSNDIDWVASVELQAAAQKWICHAISKTCNLPNNVTPDIVSQVYMRAWESGCKGFTVYRDGCRTGVLVSKEEKKNVNKIQKTNAPKRPDVLDCDVHHIKISKKLDKVRTFDYIVAVGLYEGDPYEVFVKENGTLDKKYNKGKIRKTKRGVYKLEFEDGTAINDLTESTSEEEDSLTRMTSTALRHGADIAFAVQQLEKAEGDAWGYSKSIAKALKKYIKDGKVAGDTCKKCGSSNVVRIEGCLSCKDCGDSKCG